MTATSLALITGANKGIGFEVVRQLGALGVTVLVAARDAERGTIAERSLRDLGVDAHHVALDVTDQASVDQAAQQIGAQYGRLDVLVNNAGITGGPESGRPSQTPLAILRQVYETNVFGVVAVTNAMLPLLRQAPAARIVNVSSEVGSVQATLDRDGPLWDTPIRVNAANPGYCATDLNNHSGFRSPEEGAEAIVYLATLPEDGPTGSFYGHLWVADVGPDDPQYGPLPW